MIIMTIYLRLLHPKLKWVACVHPGQHKKMEGVSMLNILRYLKTIEYNFIVHYYNK